MKITLEKHPEEIIEVDEEIIASLKRRLKMKTLKDAIIQGRKDFQESPPGVSTEEDFIKYRVAEFIWQTFRGVDIQDDLTVLDTLKKVTE